MREFLLDAPLLMGGSVGLALGTAWVTNDGMAVVLALAILAFFVLGVNYARAFDAQFRRDASAWEAADRDIERRGTELRERNAARCRTVPPKNI
jgi:hypothetical protein